MSRSSELLHAVILHVLGMAFATAVAPEGEPSFPRAHPAAVVAHHGTAVTKGMTLMRRLMRQEPRTQVSNLEKQESKASHPTIGMLSAQETLHPMIGDLPAMSAIQKETLHPMIGELPAMAAPHPEAGDLLHPMIGDLPAMPGAHPEAGDLPARRSHKARDQRAFKVPHNRSTAKDGDLAARVLTHSGSGGDLSADAMTSYSPYGSGYVEDTRISPPMISKIKHHKNRQPRESNEQFVERATDDSNLKSKQSGICPQPLTDLQKQAPTYTVINAGTVDANGDYMLKLNQNGGPPSWVLDADYQLFRDQGGVWHIMRAGVMLYDQPASAHSAETPPQGQWRLTAGSTAAAPGPCIVAAKRRKVGPPQDYFFFSRENSRDCEQGYKHIEDEHACKFAANFLGFRFVGVHHYELDHPGCRTYIFEGSRVLYFNTLQRLHPDVEHGPEGVITVCQAENIVIQYRCSGASNLSAIGLKENQANECLSACVSAAKGGTGCCQHATALIDDSSLASGSAWTCSYYAGGSIMLSEENQLGYYAAAVQPMTVAPNAASFVLTPRNEHGKDLLVTQGCVDDVDGYVEKMGETCGTFADFCGTYIEERKQTVKQMCPKTCGLCNGDDRLPGKPKNTGSSNGAEAGTNDEAGVESMKNALNNVKKFLVPGLIKGNTQSTSSNKGGEDTNDGNQNNEAEEGKTVGSSGSDDASQTKSNDEQERVVAQTVLAQAVTAGSRKMKVKDISGITIGSQITVRYGTKWEKKGVVGISSALLQAAVTSGSVEVSSPFGEGFPVGAEVQCILTVRRALPVGQPTVVHHRSTIVNNTVVNNTVVHNHHHQILRNKNCPANCSNGNITFRSKCKQALCQKCDICLLKESITNNMQQQREEMSDMIYDSISKAQSKILRETEDRIMSKIDQKIDKIVENNGPIAVTPPPTPTKVFGATSPGSDDATLLKTHDLINAWISDGRVASQATSLYYDVDKHGKMYSRLLNGDMRDSISHCPTSPPHVSTGCCVGDDTCADRLFVVKFRQHAVKHAIIRVHGNDLLHTACTVYTSVDGKQWILYDRLEGVPHSSLGYREIVVSTDMRYFAIQFSHLDVRISEFEAFSVQNSGQTCTKMVCPRSHALSEDARTKFCERSRCEVSTDLMRCCSKRASCKHLTCPIGKRVVPNSSDVLCQRQVCTSDDVETCCVKAANCAQLDEGLCGFGRYIRADASDIECDSHNCTAQDSVLCCTEPADCEYFPICSKIKKGWGNKKEGWRYKCSGPVCNKDKDFDTCCIDRSGDARIFYLKFILLLGLLFLCCFFAWKRQQSEIEEFMREKEIRDLLRQKRKNKQQDHIKPEERRVDSKDGEVLTFNMMLRKYGDKYHPQVITELWSQLKLEESYAATRLQSAFRGEQVRKEQRSFKLRRIDPADGKSYSFAEMQERNKGQMSYDELVTWWKTLEEDFSELAGKRQDVDGNFYTYDEIGERYRSTHNCTQILSLWRVLKPDEVKRKIGYVGTPQLLKNERILANLCSLITALIGRGHELTVGEPNKDLVDGTGALVTDMAAAPSNAFDIVLVAPGGPGAQAEAEKFATSAKIFSFVNLEDEQFGQPKWLIDLTAKTEKYDLPNMKTDEVARKIQEQIVAEAVKALAEPEEPGQSI